MTTMEDCIGWLKDIPCQKEPIKHGDKVIYNHVAGKNPRYVKDRETGEIRLTKFKMDTYIPNWKGLCYTIRASNAYAHPLLDRGMSVRENARIQSFPDDFIFTGSRTSMQRQIGNAVPPLMAKAIAESIKEMIESV